MNKKYTKKIFGTVIIAIFILSLTMAGFSYAQAQSNGNNKSYKFSGEVYSNDCNEQELIVTTSEGNITFELNNKTTFTRGLDCTDIYSEDLVHVIAKKLDNGEYLAKVVQKDNGAGYGRNW